MMAQASTTRTTATTVERFLDLSNDARHVYRHLLMCWLTVGEAIWSRRHIHQDLKGANRFRRIARLEESLAELVKVGLLTYIAAEPRLGPRGPRYALTEPYLLQGQRYPRRFSAVLAPPLPATNGKATSTPAGNATIEAKRTTTTAAEIAWRVDALWDRVCRTGRLEPFRLREASSPNMGCACCGVAMEEGDDRHCGLCLEPVMHFFYASRNQA